MVRTCVYCGEELSSGTPEGPVDGRRLAFDPRKGRLWEVCPACRRWNAVPLALRWEALEACERAVRDQGRILMETENLALVRVGPGELIRVGRSPRIEFAGWRYGGRAWRRPRSFWARVLGGLPPPPVGGYDPYGLQGMGGMGEPGHLEDWTASPFVERAQALTTVFASVPLAPRCPGCGRPLALAPWEFQNIRFRRSHRELVVTARCALCGEAVAADLPEVRPGLRLGLSVTTSPEEERRWAEAAAGVLDEVGGGVGLVSELARAETSLGELDPRDRLAVWIALDEAAEAEALEREWREAEEITSIMDGELTEVPGFERFRRRVLGLD